MNMFHKFGKRDAGSKGNLRIMEERRCILTPQSDFFIREAYKTLRTNVTFSLAGEGKSRVVVMTSSMQGEGKSTTAVNLAISFAETDKKVLLIDCDMRRPKLGRLLDLNAPAGLSNVLLDPELLNKAVMKSYGGIDVILAGDIPPNPSELLSSPRMAKLLEQMREQYDCIILDAPPVNMVTDAVVLAPQSDGVLFVVRAEQAERGAVMHAVGQLEYAKVKILGFVLNGVELENTSYGYGNHRYSRYRKYGYSQGYGYEQPPAPAKPMDRVGT